MPKNINKPNVSKKTVPARKKSARLASDKRPSPRPKVPEIAQGTEPAIAETSEQPAAQPAPMKSHLPAAELEKFREILLIKRAQIIGDIATLNALQKNRQESAGDLSSVPFHPADAGSDNFEQEFTFGLMGNEQSMLREIDEALDRIAKGTYGICVATQKPITKARLQAKPWAKYCIEYARAMEKGQVRRP